MPESLHDRIKRERAAALPQAKHVKTYRKYATGEQRGTIGHEQRQILGSLVGNPNADNVIDDVIDTAASRLELTGYQVQNEAVQAFLTDFFVRNQISDIQYDVHYPTLRDGNHALGLRWRNADRPGADPDDEGAEPLPSGRVTIHHEPWWDGETGMFVAYEDDGRTYAYAVKDFVAWMGDPPRERRRRTAYFADRIERYVMEGEGWQPYRLPEDGDRWPVPWTRPDGGPLGIPVVHFPNGRFGSQPYGVSDLAGGVIGLQDDVNDFQRDLSAAGRLTAYQMLWMTGHDLENAPITVGPGRVIWSANPDANTGAYPTGSLEQLIRGHETKVATVARNTKTPKHLITGGDWPSGEALIRAEVPLVDRVRRASRTIGPAWVQVGHRATEIANAFGRLRLDEDALVSPVFTPPERRDALTLAQVERERLAAFVLKRELGWSLRQIQTEWGLDEETIARMETERQTEREALGALIGQAMSVEGEGA